MSSSPIAVSARRVFIVLLSIIAALAVAYVLMRRFVVSQPNTAWRETWVNGFMQIWNLNEEVSFARWFEEGQFLLVALLLFLLAAIARSTGDRAWKWWGLLGIIFIGASADEAAQIHETFVGPMQELLGADSGPAGAGWIYPLAAGLLVLIVVFARFYFRLPRATKLLFALSFVVFVTGAAGFELFAWSLNTVIFVDDYWHVFFVSTLCEETLEMVGLAIFSYALMRHLRDHAPENGRVLISVV